MTTTLTPEQIRTTVATMRMAEPLKVLLLDRALRGEPEARFVLYAAWRRQQALTDPH